MDIYIIRGCSLDHHHPATRPVPSTVAGTVVGGRYSIFYLAGHGGRYRRLYRRRWPVQYIVPAMGAGTVDGTGHGGDKSYSGVKRGNGGKGTVGTFLGITSVFLDYRMSRHQSISWFFLAPLNDCRMSRHGQTELRSRDQMSRDELRSRDQMIAGCHVIGGFHGSCLPPQ